MKKIMFNDRYGLTQAVIEGRKTMTRRIVRNQEEYYELRWFQPYVTREKALYGYDDLRGGMWHRAIKTSVIPTLLWTETLKTYSMFEAR